MLAIHALRQIYARDDIIAALADIESSLQRQSLASPPRPSPRRLFRWEAFSPFSFYREYRLVSTSSPRMLIRESEDGCKSGGFPGRAAASLCAPSRLYGFPVAIKIFLFYHDTIIAMQHLLRKSYRHGEPRASATRLAPARVLPRHFRRRPAGVVSVGRAAASPRLAGNGRLPGAGHCRVACHHAEMMISGLFAQVCSISRVRVSILRGMALRRGHYHHRPPLRGRIEAIAGDI